MPVEQLYSQGHLIASSYRNAGGFDSVVLSYRQREIREQAIRWVETVEQTLPKATAAGIQKLLAWYDILHIIAYGKKPAFSYVYAWMKKVIMALARGEKADRIMLMRWVNSHLHTHPDDIEPAVAEWYRAVIGRWTDQLEYPLSVSQEYDVEILRKVNFLVGENRCPDDAGIRWFKEMLVARWMPALSLIEKEESKPGTVSPEMLEALDELSFYASLQNPEIDYWDYRARILQLLSNHPCLDHDSRLAFQLDLENEKKSLVA